MKQQEQMDSTISERSSHKDGLQSHLFEPNGANSLIGSKGEDSGWTESTSQRQRSALALHQTKLETDDGFEVTNFLITVILTHAMYSKIRRYLRRIFKTCQRFREEFVFACPTYIGGRQIGWHMKVSLPASLIAA